MLTKQQKEILENIIKNRSCTGISCEYCYEQFGEGKSKLCYLLSRSEVLVEKAEKMLSNSIRTYLDEEQIILNQTN